MVWSGITYQKNFGEVPVGRQEEEEEEENLPSFAQPESISVSKRRRLVATVIGADWHQQAMSLLLLTRSEISFPVLPLGIDTMANWKQFEFMFVFVFYLATRA